MGDRSADADSTKLLAYGAMAAGALAGGYFLLRHLFAVEEPPIRVRRNSIHLDLLGQGKWRYDNHGRFWWIPALPRRNPYYRIQTTTNSGACDLTRIDAAIATFHHSTGEWVQLDARTKRTKVTASQGLFVSADETKLVMCRPGYVMELVVKTEDGSRHSCTFAEGQFLEATAVDP